MTVLNVLVISKTCLLCILFIHFLIGSIRFYLLRYTPVFYIFCSLSCSSVCFPPSVFSFSIFYGLLSIPMFFCTSAEQAQAITVSFWGLIVVTFHHCVSCSTLVINRHKPSSRHGRVCIRSLKCSSTTWMYLRFLHFESLALIAIITVK